MQQGRAWRVAAVAVLQAGCAGIAERPGGAEVEAAAPPVWRAAASAPATEAVATPAARNAWWQRFADASLADLLAEARRGNTDLRGARAALAAARAARESASAALGPTVAVSGTAQRSRSAGHYANSFQTGFDASWELDVFGARRDAVDAALAELEASVASLADVRVSIEAEVALAYIDLRSAQARLAIARDSLAAQQETLDIAGWRVQAGLATSIDVEQARSAVEQTRATLPVLHTAIGQSISGLAALTGAAPASLGRALEAFAPLPMPGAELAASLPAETLRQRADVRAAERRVAAAAARVQAADAARYPRFDLGGSLGLSALSLGALGERSSVVGALLGSVAWPLVDQGAALAALHAEQAGYESARASYRAAVLVALKEVEDALTAIAEDRRRRESLAVAADAAANAALLATQRYRSGLVDFLTVLDTQRTLLSLQDGLAIAEAAVVADHVRLYKALGGGWEPDAAARADALARR